MDYRDGYEFKPDDKFQLSVLGTDLRYEVKKEEEQAKICSLHFNFHASHLSFCVYVKS